jgi:hypothetical protein
MMWGYAQEGEAMAYPADYVQAADDARILTPVYWFAWASTYPETDLF